jgi:hypothetical protein
MEELVVKYFRRVLYIIPTARGTLWYGKLLNHPMMVGVVSLPPKVAPKM